MNPSIFNSQSAGPRIVLLVALVLPTLGAGADFDRAHGLLGQVLATYVHQGLVDYSGLKAHHARLDSYVSALGSVSPHELASWNRQDQFAFWINAYNAFTLKVVVDHYPIQGSWFSLYPRNSIRQIPGVWDQITFTAAGRAVTLTQIEHEILRKQFADPRLHAAINCASMSCPELRAEPYLGDRLDAQLDDAAHRFATDAARNRIDLSAKTIAASRIFNWFTADFVEAYVPGGSFAGLSGKDAAAAAFLARFGPPAVGEAIRAGGFSVRFQSYNWSLNEASRAGEGGGPR